MPKRATLHACWGPKYIAEAIESAKTAKILGVDRILVTDHASLPLVPKDAPFERVVTYPFRLPGLLAKADMVEFLPAEYDSFLFLDTDTWVLLDVSMGFEKAEKHGIAAAMAPHYSLEHFWDFSQVLDRFPEIPRGSILQYNTGVLFLSRRADVWQVLRDWQGLCHGVARQVGFENDQPYFTLAMERRGFNPYTLSPAYNYRNFGEAVSGLIRVWHSRMPPPVDVNVFLQAWPPRSFKNGVRSG